MEPKARLITLTETLIIRDITKTEFNKYFIHTVALHLTAGVLILVLIFASLGHFTTGKPASDIKFNVYNGEGFYSHPDVISPAFLRALIPSRNRTCRHPILATKDLRDLLNENEEVCQCPIIYNAHRDRFLISENIEN